MENPKISVVIPVYNSENVLRRCIDSLLAQTYRNIEFIFVDDGSQDNGLQILLEASQRDSRIRYMSRPNGGVSAARNTGMACAEGKYLMFCDADDTVSPVWCETLVRTIQQNPDSWIICGIQIMDEGGAEIACLAYPEGIYDKSVYVNLFKCGYSACAYNKIFDLERIRRSGLQFDEGRMRGEDVVFSIEYLLQVENIVVIDQPLYQYYRYESSETLTNRYHADDYQDLCELYWWRKKIITPDKMEVFQNYYWDKFMTELNRTMQYNEGSFSARIRLNDTIIGTNEFQELLDCCGKKQLNRAAYKFLAAGKYIGFYFIQQLHSLKKKLH